MEKRFYYSPMDGGGRGDEIDARLWEYIDGLASAEEKTTIEKLIQSNGEWKEKYKELLDIHQLAQASSLEEPSLRFTKNVMEGIAKYHIAPATKTYINKKIVLGIGIFFIVLILGFVAYGFGQVNWNTEGDTSFVSKIDFSKFFNNTYINIFMMVNVV